MVNKGIKYLGRGTAWTAEKVISELGLISAIASTANDGNYLSKVIYGLSAPVRVVFDSGMNYLTNEGIRDAFNVGALDIMAGLGNVAENITEKPLETGLAALTTFGICKSLPLLSKKIRKNFRKRFSESE